MIYEHKSITIRSTVTEGSIWHIPAYVAPCGLAYHQSHYGDHNGPDWTVTHVASGTALGKYACHFETPDQCRRFIARVSELADWSVKEPALTDEIKTTVSAAAQVVQELSITYL